MLLSTPVARVLVDTGLVHLDRPFDYLVPAAPDVLRYRTDTTVTEATTNVLGVKAVGETGATAAPPAIVNGVLDALRPLDTPQYASPDTDD